MVQLCFLPGLVCCFLPVLAVVEATCGAACSRPTDQQRPRERSLQEGVPPANGDAVRKDAVRKDASLIFAMADTDGNGIISRKECRLYFAGMECGNGIETADALFQKFDADGSDGLDITEFVALCVALSEQASRPVATGDMERP